MNVEEVNVVVCCAEDEGYKSKLFATLGKISGKQDKLHIVKDNEETESFLKKSVTIDFNNKDVQVTFIDGGKDIGSNSSDILTDTIYDVDVGLVLYPLGTHNVQTEKCEAVVMKMLEIFPNVSPLVVGVINYEGGSNRPKYSRQTSQSSVYQLKDRGKISTEIMKQFPHLKYDVSKVSHVTNLVQFVIKESMMSLQKKDENQSSKSRKLKEQYQYRMTGLNTRIKHQV